MGWERDAGGAWASDVAGPLWGVVGEGWRTCLHACMHAYRPTAAVAAGCVAAERWGLSLQRWCSTSRVVSQVVSSTRIKHLHQHECQHRTTRAMSTMPHNQG